MSKTTTPEELQRALDDALGMVWYLGMGCVPDTGALNIDARKQAERLYRRLEPLVKAEVASEPESDEAWEQKTFAAETAECPICGGTGFPDAVKRGECHSEATGWKAP